MTPEDYQRWTQESTSGMSLAQNGEPQNGISSLHLPSDADIDRMVTFMDRVWHRLVDAVERAQKQVLNKS